jgi:hypothetical protein
VHEVFEGVNISCLCPFVMQATDKVQENKIWGQLDDNLWKGFIFK